MSTPTPTKTETITSNIPSWAEGIAKSLLGFGSALTFPKQKIDPATGQVMRDAAGNPILETGFQPYQGELVADESALQKQVYGDLSKMQVAPQIGQATGFTGLAALQAQNLAKYDPIADKQYYQSVYDQPGGIDKYMSPYIQNVLEQQKREAARDYARQIPGMGAASARMGGRGGTREALMRAEGQRNLQQQLQGIQATGMQNAFQNAQLQAAQEAQMKAQYGLAGSQLREQSRQFGAGLGMQGLQQQLAAANLLGQLGQQQYQQQAGILQAQLNAGNQQQALKQRMLETNYQKFIDEMQYPYKQLEFMSNLLRGIPSTDTTTRVYSPPPSTLGMLTGVTGGLGGLFGSLGK